MGLVQNGWSVGRGAGEGYRKHCLHFQGASAWVLDNQVHQQSLLDQRGSEVQTLGDSCPLPCPFRPRQQLEGRGVITHPNPQCQINQVKLKFQVPSRVWKKDRSTIVGTFCTAPLPVADR